jgi:sister-chromatid-cohesion protein PDS5
MDAVHRRGSLHLVNTSAIPTLVKRVQRGTAGASHARALLTFTAKHCPALFQPHVSELAKALADEKNPELVEVSLQALAAVAKWDAALSPTDKWVTGDSHEAVTDGLSA